MKDPTPINATTLRLHVLREVKAAWIEIPNVGRFTQWLDQEITRCLNPGVSRALPKPTLLPPRRKDGDE